MSPKREELLPAELVSELCQYEGPEALSDCLTRRKALLSPAVVEQLTETVRQRVRVDVEESLRLAEAALIIARELSDRSPNLSQTLPAAVRGSTRGGCGAHRLRDVLGTRHSVPRLCDFRFAAGPTRAN